MQEKHLEKPRDVLFAFVDLEKAYNRVPRKQVYWCLIARSYNKWRGGEGRPGVTTTHCYNREKEMAGRKKDPLIQRNTGCQKMGEEREETEEDMAGYISRRPGRDGCPLAWSPPDRQ